MFTGIVEEIGTVKGMKENGGQVNLTIGCSFAEELKVDQSVAVNGVCLTVTEKYLDSFGCIAIRETLKKTNIGQLKEGVGVNLERAMRFDQRLDGHIVQGHVDKILPCQKVDLYEGSKDFWFPVLPEDSRLLIPRGSVTLNGISLTIAELTEDSFKVSIIPYTLKHTNINQVDVGDLVNVEFDLIGKYVVGWRLEG